MLDKIFTYRLKMTISFMITLILTTVYSYLPPLLIVYIMFCMMCYVLTRAFERLVYIPGLKKIII